MIKIVLATLCYLSYNFKLLLTFDMKCVLFVWFRFLVLLSVRFNELIAPLRFAACLCGATVWFDEALRIY